MESSNYREYGFRLWAVVLKETGELIGDCRITIQNIDGEYLPELGCHIHKKYWRQGFGSDAARTVRDWVFEHTQYETLYSYIKYTNFGSYSTALANGMKKVKEIPRRKKRHLPRLRHHPQGMGRPLTGISAWRAKQ